MEQIKGISDAVIENKAVVEDVLIKHLDGAVYENVVFG